MGRTIIKGFIWICFCLLHEGAFAQYKYNNVYDPDPAGFSQMVEDVVSDEELNSYAVVSHKASGISTYQIVKFDPSGNILSSYTPPLNQNRQEGLQNSLIINQDNLFHLHSNVNESLVCVDRIDKSLNILDSWCFNTGFEVYATSIDFVTDSLMAISYSTIEDVNSSYRDINILALDISGEEKWRRTIGEENKHEHDEGIKGFNNRIYLAYRNNNLRLEVKTIAIQGFDIKTKSFPNHNYLLWARNQEEGDNIFGAIFRGSSVIRDGIGSLNLDAQSLDIISEQYHTVGTGAVAQRPVLVGETLYFPSGASFGYERSFMLVTDAITGDSLDIKWFEPEKDSACMFKTINVLDNGQFILGGYTHEVFPVEPRRAWMVKTDRWGCASELCLDVEEVAEEENEWRIYPNPTIQPDYVSVTLSMPLADLSNPEYQVFNSSGVLINTISVKQKEFQLQKPTHSGFYMVVLKDENKVVDTQKWIVL